MIEKEALIVGINSFLGRAIYELIKEQYSITGVYHSNTENIPADIEIIQVDDIKKLKNRSFKHIYLISSSVPDGVEDDQKLFLANIILPHTISTLFPESRILFCSSVSVYENLAANTIISNADMPSPRSKYALSKLWGERTIENHASFAIIRISSMYGVGMKTTTFVPKIIENVIETKKINLLGEGRRMQNYIHVEDVARIAVGLAQTSENIMLLAVANQSYSNKEIAEMILNITPGQLSFAGKDDSKSHIYDNTDTHTILKDINFKDIKAGLEELVAWIKKKC
ncbi:NAD(P)-dependent oxidoreductase [Mucilaginibacter sabulilitoris]|uniref:NAD(P)-dependent oxidoreductase n=1 Tax=Mucilaginibacter sabulilitoris TaxID=1173583 RepID=A0ABZ0TSA0_9SPHI|nr:NAD(P)-dependent oxidoreductase [Mucilaginibacter sabulilitoris]WPU95787.1 NAD(P)-dependent oxidoreductase [Mucilaginibacter sabulilitoris]